MAKVSVSYVPEGLASYSVTVADGFSARPAAVVGRWSLRLHDGARQAVSQRLGLSLQASCLAADTNDKHAALRLSQDEWLLLALAEDHGLEQQLAGLSSDLAVAVDISHAYEGIAVSGPASAEALSVGCPLDLHASVFPIAACTRTLFGKVGICLWKRAADAYHLEYSRSHRSYVWELLSLAGQDIATQL